MYAPYVVSNRLNLISALAERRMHPRPVLTVPFPLCVYGTCISQPQVISPVGNVSILLIPSCPAPQKNPGAAPGLTCETRTARRMFKEGEKHPAKKTINSQDHASSGEEGCLLQLQEHRQRCRTEWYPCHQWKEGLNLSGCKSQP